MLIQILTATGNNVYVLIWNFIGQIWNKNTNAFEAYTVSNWTSYAVPTVEQASSGNYFVTVLGITTPGAYTFAGYIRSGATPTPPPVDTPTTPGNSTIPTPAATFSVPTSLSALILDLRMQVRDGPVSKLISSETLGGSDQPAFPVDGVNTTFRLKSSPLSDVAGAPAYTYVTIIGNGATTRTQSGFTIVDQINGIINFSVAPNPGSASQTAGVYVDYYYQWFTDAEYAEFLYQAAQFALAGTTDPTLIPNGLSFSMMQFAMAQFWYARASQYGEKYAATAGDSSEAVNTVSDAYMKLGKAAQAIAQSERTAYYQRQGQREAPAFGDPRSFPPPRFDKITPRR